MRTQNLQLVSTLYLPISIQNELYYGGIETIGSNMNHYTRICNASLGDLIVVWLCGIVSNSYIDEFVRKIDFVVSATRRRCCYGS